MTYHALLEYIHQAKDCGASDVEIADRLHGAGWYRVDIQDALDLYRKLTASTSNGDYTPQREPPKPSLTERIAPRHYDVNLIAVAAISFAVGFIVYVWLTHY